MRHARVAVTILDRLMRLSAEAKVVYFSLLLGPHRTTAPGLFRGGPAALAEASETTPETFRGCVAELEARGLVAADFERRVVFLPSAVEDDPPANPNTIRSWSKVLDEIPPCEVKTTAHKALRDATAAACALAERRAQEQAKKDGKEWLGWFGGRWAELLGPSPQAPSGTPNASSDASGLPNGSGNGFENGSGNSPSRVRDARASPTPTPIPTPTPTQTPGEERGPGGGEGTAPPLAAFASGSGGGGAGDSLRGGTDESEEPPFVPPTCEQLIRAAEKNGSTATKEEFAEFLEYFGAQGWKHRGKALTADNYLTAFAWHRGKCRAARSRGAGGTSVKTANRVEMLLAGVSAEDRVRHWPVRWAAEEKNGRRAVRPAPRPAQRPSRRGGATA